MKKTSEKKPMGEVGLQMMKACEGIRKVIFRKVSDQFPGKIECNVSGLFPARPARRTFQFPVGQEITVRIKMNQNKDKTTAHLLAWPVNLTSKSISPGPLTMEVNFYQGRSGWISNDPQTGKIIVIADNELKQPTDSSETWRIDGREFETVIVANLIEMISKAEAAPAVTEEAAAIEEDLTRTPEQQLEATIQQTYSHPPKYSFPVLTPEQTDELKNLIAKKGETEEEKGQIKDDVGRFLDQIGRQEVNPYQVLELTDSDASLADIKQAFKTKARQFLPDFGAKEEDMAALNLSYLYMQFQHCVAYGIPFEEIDLDRILQHVAGFLPASSTPFEVNGEEPATGEENIVNTTLPAPPPTQPPPTKTRKEELQGMEWPVLADYAESLGISTRKKKRATLEDEILTKER